jgi:osmotically-inducible protein OsmY
MVDGGVVTLSGTVPSWSEYDAACDTAWSTPGVQSVVDNLVVVY